jgi:hypothetical protein
VRQRAVGVDETGTELPAALVVRRYSFVALVNHRWAVTLLYSCYTLSTLSLRSLL